MLGSFTERCTVLLVVSAVCAVVAVRLVRNKPSVAAGMCCFAIAWHIASLDAALWIVDSFRSIGPPSASDIHQSLITSLLSLPVPLLALAVMCVIGNFSGYPLGRGPLVMLASSCVALVDLILLLLVCSDVAIVAARSGFT